MEYSKECTADYVMLIEPENNGNNTKEDDEPQVGKYEKLCGSFSENITM